MTTDDEIIFEWSKIKAKIFSEIQGTPKNNEDEKLAAIRLWRMAEMCGYERGKSEKQAEEDGCSNPKACKASLPIPRPKMPRER